MNFHSKNKSLLKIVAITSAFVMTGWTNASQSEGVALQKPKQTVAEITPKIADVKLTKQTIGNNQFAFELFQDIRNTSSNLFYSPFSISSALAMVYTGAEGNTKKELSKTLHFPDKEELDFSAVSKSKNDNIQLNIGNSLWGQNGYPFNSVFLETLNKKFGSKLHLADFKTDGGRNKASSDINQWVSQETEGKITKLIDKGFLSETTRLVLANAIYFKAKWATPFKESGNQSFSLLDNDFVITPSMNVKAFLKYTKGADYQAIELPYKGNQMSMVILLPTVGQGQFENISKSLNYQYVEQLLGAMKARPIELAMPKFNIATELSLADTLNNMGIKDAFSSENSDFSAMKSEAYENKDENIYISKILHKAVIKIDETGTVAAAATTVGKMSVGCGDNAFKISIDRPFIFIIRDLNSGAVLFVGQVLNPLKN